MSANDLSFQQSAAILNAIHEQATGQTSIAPLNTADFITMGTTVLKTGYDNTINAISQVLSKTIFSIRPYSAMLKGLRADTQRFGNHIRKITFVDKDYVDDQGVSLVDGSAVDQWKIRNPEALQTNFYGYNDCEDYITIFQDQLDVAFSGPGEFGSFITGVMTNISNKHEQKHDEIARLTLCNFIAAKITADSGNVIHLLTEYNTATGQSLTSTSVMQAANYKAFMQWVYARIAEITSMMRNRSVKYHMNITGKDVMRHTPYDRQKVYTLSKYKFSIEAMVLADTYHDNYIKMADVEAIDFWQDIESPDTVNVVPNYIDSAGAIQTAGSAVNKAAVFGLIMDEDAAGYTVKNVSMNPTPFNARGRYYNIWWNFQDKWWNDLTENAVVLLLD